MSAVPSHIVAPKLDLVRPIVFLDAETTGLNANSDRVVELALVKVYPGGPLMLPDHHLPRGVAALDEHGRCQHASYCGRLKWRPMKEQPGWEEMYFDWGPRWYEVPGRYKGKTVTEVADMPQFGEFIIWANENCPDDFMAVINKVAAGQLDGLKRPIKQQQQQTQQQEQQQQWCQQPHQHGCYPPPNPWAPGAYPYQYPLPYGYSYAPPQPCCCPYPYPYPHPYPYAYPYPNPQPQLQPHQQPQPLLQPVAAATTAASVGTPVLPGTCLVAPHDPLSLQWQTVAELVCVLLRAVLIGRGTNGRHLEGTVGGP